MDATSFERAASPVRQDLISSSISRMKSGGKDNEPEMVAKEIESLFATLLVSEMRKGLDGGFFGGGAGSDTFNGWFDEEIGSSMASRGSLGLADDVHEAIVKQKAAAEAEAQRHAREGREEAPS